MKSGIQENSILKTGDIPRILLAHAAVAMRKKRELERVRVFNTD